MNDTTSDIPLSLYVHFPWCVRKCPYCDFNSHEPTETIPFRAYVDKLIMDLDQELSKLTIPVGRELVSIFLGGGTPSLFPHHEIDRLLSAIRERFDITYAEITIEANPGTFDQSHFSGYREAGVNRISLGAQSFSPDALQKLGRIHDPDDVFYAFEGSRSAGFERINLDLMHGLPDQTLDKAMNDLDSAIVLAPEHLSWYQLTVEPNTVFYKRPPQLPVEDTLADIATAGKKKLRRAGYEQYETSAYAKPGEQARHNLNYWRFGDYLGIGAWAHGKITRNNQIQRSAKTRVPADYLREPTTNINVVAPEELTLEFLMNALRLTSGFELSLYEARTGLHRQTLRTFLARASDKGLLEYSDHQVMPTERGRVFLNELLLMID